MATEPLPSSLKLYRPSSQEQKAYEYLFGKADTESLGVLTGDLAVPFFSHSALPPILLGEIWQLADPDNNGFLSPERFGVACRLIGHAQALVRDGKTPRVDEQWVGKPGPLPTFKGYPLPTHLASSTSSFSTPPTSPSRSTSSVQPPQPLHPQSTGGSQRAGGGGGGGGDPSHGVDINSISNDDKAKYARLFAGANGGNLTGLLDGEKARDIFIKSNLPYEILGQIWNLSDTHSRGSLDLTDFTIGMHLLQLVLTAKLGPTTNPNLPRVLDPRMYASAAGLNAPGVGSTGASASTTTKGSMPQSPLRQSSIATPSSSSSMMQVPWKVTPTEKQESDQWFDQLDQANKGVLEGEQAVGFFGQSGLDVAVLAKIWDLSDLTDSGSLTRDTFAVAMKLVREKVANPTTFQLPDSLPIEYVPIHLRANYAGGGGGGTSNTETQPPSQPQRDLLDLMDDEGGDDLGQVPTPTSRQFSTSPPPSAAGSSFAPLQPQATGRSFQQRSLSPQATGSSFQGQGLRGTIFPQLTGQGVAQPGSGGGGGGANVVSPQATGDAPRSSGFGNDNFAPSQPKTSSTFFDDNDDADTSSHLAALQGQKGQLEKESNLARTDVETTKRSRVELEQEVEKTLQEVKKLQDQVATSRQTLERERASLDELTTKDAEQKEVLARAKKDLISCESDLSKLKMDKSELEGEYLRDKEEVRQVQKRLAIVEQEKRILHDEIDKVRKEQRREKGLAAIARKQMSQAEQDRTRLEREFEELKNAPIASPASPADTPRAPEPSAYSSMSAPVEAKRQPEHVPLPLSTVTSPAASTRSNNPFDRINLASAGLSPQSTGTTSQRSPAASGSTNPFPFPGPSSSSPDGQTTSREGAASTSDEEHGDKSNLAVPALATAAAGAVGAGALLAMETAGHSISNVFGGAGASEDQKPKEEEDPFAVPSTTTATTAARSDPAKDEFEGFGDDFSSTPAQTASTDADRAEFDDAFGDDFSASTPAPPTEVAEGADAGGRGPDTAIGTLGQVDPDAGFDDAFEELEPPSTAGHARTETAETGTTATTTTTTTEPEVVEGTLGQLDNSEGFEDAFQDFEGNDESTRAAVTGHDDDKAEGTLGEIDRDAGFDEAFDELDHPRGQTALTSEDKGKGKAVEEDEVEQKGETGFVTGAPDVPLSNEEGKGEETFIEHAHKPDISQEEESSDDEDDEGPEDLDRPAAYGQKRSVSIDEPRPEGSRSASPVRDEPSVATSSALDSPVLPLTDAAPSAETEATDRPSELERQGKSNSESGESYVHVSPSTAESSTILEREPTSQGQEGQSPPVEPLPVPTPVVAPTGTQPTQRRAAPPPPTRAAAVLPVAPAPPSTTQVPDDFDRGFDGTRLTGTAATVPDAETPNPLASGVTNEDDFESTFADMAINPTERSKKEANADFDTFDDDFDFKPSFDQEQAQGATGAPEIGPLGAKEPKSDFDDAAFAEFDDSFTPAAAAETSSTTAPAAHVSTPPPPAVSTIPSTSGPTPSGFSFASSFGKFPFADDSEPSTSTPAPGSTAAPALAPPVTSPPPMARAPSVGQGDARDDDSSDVKQICGMGFSRDMAIEALAKYDHDLNRAINSLLG
ncbi:hypothetical protein JCM10212_005808 [Sporobolomyces blumeae]